MAVVQVLACFWGINFILEMRRKKGGTTRLRRKFSNKTASASSSKVYLQAVVAKVWEMTYMGCLEHQANDFVPGKKNELHFPENS